MIYVLLVALNEEKALPKLFEAILDSFSAGDESYSIVVVDDGSTDATAVITRQYAGRMPITLLQHGVNKGLGAGIRTGLRYIADTADKGDFIVTLDADNTHSPQLMVDMVEEARAGSDIVIASRYALGGKEVGLSLHRRLLSRCASIMLTCCLRIKGVKDYTCGFRLYSAHIIQRAFEFYQDKFITETGFTCMAQILAQLAPFSPKISEVGLVLRYDLKEGASKMKIFRTIGGYFRLLLDHMDLVLAKERGRFSG
ncbi:glycosyltransferase family 2 protein [Metallumcola ferriviriculae]|uniref:Glycosyltransferase family 2 protein n=1 Tax=Metallumcola ferriviriculae TaxID=3039180 RepID=A0AAU0UNZ0_9FIRM|nr:glycosyltransferase family 2 protein [Desulfitibacteraceae bacterium MK1]